MDLTKLEELQARERRTVQELKDINDKLEADPRAPGAEGLKQRAENLVRGSLNLREAIREEQHRLALVAYDGIKAGHYGAENGDGSGDPLDIPIGRAAAEGKSLGEMFVKSLTKAKFDRQRNPSVVIDGHALFASKGQTVPSYTDSEWYRPAINIVPLGLDSRFMWPSMMAEDLKDRTSITDFKVTAGTVTGTIERSPAAVTDKASLATTTVLVEEAVKQFAITIDDIPNAVLDSVPLLVAYMEQVGRFRLEEALDSHVLAQIVAATPPNGTTGTGLLAQIRSGVKSMRALGATPTLAVLNPDDSESLDTLTTADGVFILTDPATSAGGDGQVWSLRRVERIGAGTEDPYIIDPAMLGVLYLGGLRIDADPYTGFKKNTTTLRLEFNALMHVRNKNGAYRIGS